VAAFERLGDEVAAGAAGGAKHGDAHSVQPVQGTDHRGVHAGGGHQHVTRGWGPG
jgi:hypothetical protein